MLDLCGLCCCLVGLLIIVRYGLPYKRMARQVNLMEHKTVDEILTIVERVKIQKRAYWGISFIIVGLCLQIGAYCV